jgi:hypothetical protein
MKKIIVLLLQCLPIWLFAQDLFPEKALQFLSYEKVPTWMALISDWQTPTPKVHYCDTKKYKGHADYVAGKLKPNTTFQLFKSQSKANATRQYLPIHIYDLAQMPLEVEGKTYTWALFLVDYGYSDRGEAMAQSVLKAAACVQKSLQQLYPNTGKGIILLATSPDVQPNTSIREKINANGYPNLTVTGLLQKVGARNLKILNEGVAVGRLVFVPAGKEESTALSFQEIAVFEKLPLRVPIVNGIITLAPQTPLSHVNLLAKNRGTLNVYVQDWQDLPQLKENVGKLVRITGKGEKVVISPISLTEAQSFWNLQKQLQVSIPKPNFEVKKMVAFEPKNETAQQVNCIGAKAANYALLRQNFPQYTRKGFAIPFYFYQETIKQCGADILITNFLSRKKDLSEVERKYYLEKIRNTIKTGEISEDLQKQMRFLVENEFMGTNIRLRSSTNCEDLAQFNGAGLYESKGVKTPKMGANKENWTDFQLILQKNLLNVYASLWNEEAYQEREFYQIKQTETSMAVLINESYKEEYANGVSITIPDEEGGYRIFINAQMGENLVTNPASGEVAEGILFSSPAKSEYSIQATSNIGNVFVQNPDLKIILEELRVLTNEIHTLLITKQQAEKGKFYGVDIEFKVMKKDDNYQLFVKQARLLGSKLPE